MSKEGNKENIEQLKRDLKDLIEDLVIIEYGGIYDGILDPSDKELYELYKIMTELHEEYND